MKPRPLRTAICGSPRYGRATVAASPSTSDDELWSEPLHAKSTSEIGKPVSADPTDLAEWVDVIILAFDGATRCAQHLGLPMSSIAEGIIAKQTKNEARRWPDWRAADPNKAIEHVREA